MSQIRRILTAAVVSASLGGCAIHPLPEQVTCVDTPHIVRQIRCETREAVKSTLMDFLASIADGRFAGYPEGVRNPIADHLLALYAENPELMDTFNSSLFPGPQYVHEREAIDLLLKAGAAYTFDFDIFEDNDIGATVNLLRDITPTFTAGINGSAKRRRSNERTFTVTDTFRFLLANLNAAKPRNVRYCDGQIVGPNYVYPITGRVGVDRTVKDFSRLLLFGGLAGKDGKAGAAPTMTDDLIFTTTVTLQGTPRVVFAPVGRSCASPTPRSTSMLGAATSIRSRSALPWTWPALTRCAASCSAVEATAAPLSLVGVPRRDSRPPCCSPGDA
jgi:hypothetical protein